MYQNGKQRFSLIYTFCFLTRKQFPIIKALTRFFLSFKIFNLYPADELRDWFIVNSAALYKMCGDAVSFLPKLEPNTEPELESQFPAVDGDQGDWADLKALVKQLGVATASLTAPQPATQQQLTEPSVGATDSQALIQEKRRNLDPVLIASAQARLLELQAQEEQQAKQPVQQVEKEQVPLPPSVQQQEQEKEKEQLLYDLGITCEYIDGVYQAAESSRLKLLKIQAQEQRGGPTVPYEPDEEHLLWLEYFGGEEKLGQFLVEAAACMEALGRSLPADLSVPLPYPSLVGATAAAATVAAVAPENSAEEEGLLEEEQEDFRQRWEHVAPGYAARMKKAEADGYYKVIDAQIHARQAALVAAGSAAVCDALQVEVRNLLE
jgi:hypothetical protein